MEFYCGDRGLSGIVYIAHCGQLSRVQETERAKEVKISGFSFIHNALHAGYPIVEAIRAVQPFVDEVVVVDMESADGTRELLERLDVRILDGEWTPGAAGECLRKAHALYKECAGDVIVHFEGDEVYSPNLLTCIIGTIVLANPHANMSFKVWRLQVEQNFQRVRWYPELVHRVFMKKDDIVKQGHTTDCHNQAIAILARHGFLWDVTNCFRDQWYERVCQQAELWGTSPMCYGVPVHSHQVNRVDDLKEFLDQPHWTWTTTPLAIPDILKPLVGKVRYEPNIS